jgi:hypothetical protein
MNNAARTGLVRALGFGLLLVPLAGCCRHKVSTPGASGIPVAFVVLQPHRDTGVCELSWTTKRIELSLRKSAKQVRWQLLNSCAAAKKIELRFAGNNPMEGTLVEDSVQPDETRPMLRRLKDSAVEGKYPYHILVDGLVAKDPDLMIKP